MVIPIAKQHFKLQHLLIMVMLPKRYCCRRYSRCHPIIGMKKLSEMFAVRNSNATSKVSPNCKIIRVTSSQSTYSSGANVTSNHANQDMLRPTLAAFGGLNGIMMMYEDFVGLTEVKQAQEKVVNAEQKFLQVQEDRRNMQQELLTVQAEVRKIAAELEKTSRTDTRYIDLVKKEHEILLVEKDMNNKIKTLDRAERDFFSSLSAALRESHEKERARAEKTKYWSIIGSVIGAIIGIAGSTFNNMKRMKELRAIVTENVHSTSEYKQVAENLIKTVASRPEFTHLGIEDDFQAHKLDIKNSLVINPEILNAQTESIKAHFERQSAALVSQLMEIHKVLSVNQALANDQHVVYVGPEIESMLHKTEEKLENISKRNVYFSAASVVLSILMLAVIIKGT